MADEIIDRELIFVRHARSWGNEENKEEAPAFDEKNPPLSPVGLLQAALLCSRFEKGGADMVFCSPLLRAVETVLPVCEKLNLKIELLPSLVETDTEIFGTAEDGLSALSKRIILPYTHYIPCEDTEEHRKTRAAAAMDYILEKSSGCKRVIIVSHGTFLKYLYEYILGIGGDTFRWSNDNCAITRIILYKNMPPKLKQQNDRLHLLSTEPEYFIYNGD